MKLPRVFAVSYTIGWSIKLTIVAMAVGWFVSRRRQEKRQLCQSMRQNSRFALGNSPQLCETVVCIDRIHKDRIPQPSLIRR